MMMLKFQVAPVLPPQAAALEALEMEPAEVLNIKAAPVCPLGPSLGTGPAYVSARLTGVAR